MRKIIYGCGGHARSIINTLYEKEKDIETLIVDKNANIDEVILTVKVKREYELQDKDFYIVAIGDNFEREELYNYLQNRQIGNSMSVISNAAYIGVGAEIGTGTFVACKAYIGPQVKIGENAIINTGSIIEHESIIGKNAHIAPHATVCGRVKIGNNVFCGAGSIIIDKMSICNNVIIGAGAVVKDNITMPGTYVGVPAIRIK